MLVVIRYFAALALLSYAIAMNSQAKQQSTPNQKSVCAFITERMTSAFPQVPLLCDSTRNMSGMLDVKVFATKNVFLTDLRRGWSSAFFVTLGALFNRQVDERSLLVCFLTVLGEACPIPMLLNGRFVTCFFSMTIRVREKNLGQNFPILGTSVGGMP